MCLLFPERRIPGLITRDAHRNKVDLWKLPGQIKEQLRSLAPVPSRQVTNRGRRSLLRFFREFKRGGKEAWVIKPLPEWQSAEPHRNHVDSLITYRSAWFHALDRVRSDWVPWCTSRTDHISGGCRQGVRRRSAHGARSTRSP